MSQKTPPASTSADLDRATEFARAVIAKQIVAGPDVRNACRRHMRDLRSGHKRGLVFDLESANRAIGFF